MSFNLDQSYEGSTDNNTGNGIFNLRRAANNNTILGQSFTTSNSQKINRITLNLKKEGSPSGNIWVKIKVDGADPTITSQVGSDSNTIAVSAISSASFAWYDFDFATPLTVSSSTKYWILLYGDYTEAVDVGIYWAIDTTSPTYANGNAGRYGNGSAAWEDITTYDALFREYTDAVSPSASLSPSLSPSASRSPSASISPSASRSPSSSFSASLSPSASISSSISPSASRSPSSSFSASVSPSASRSPSSSSSPSLSPSSSISASVSPSASLSPSSSISPSISPSNSLSPSSSISASVSPSASLSPSSSASNSISASPSQGYSLDSKGVYSVLPNNNNNLTNLYTENEEERITTYNHILVNQSGSLAYLMHQFRRFIGINTRARVESVCKTDLSPSLSPVYLQIFNKDTAIWETIDTDSSSQIDIDFVLEADIPSTTNYKDDSNVITCRIYQLAI